MMNPRNIFLGLALLVASLSSANAGAASKEEIDAQVKQTVENFYQYTSAGKELAGKASGMLVFPSVVKAGVGIGGEYGEGALLVSGKIVAYYNVASASVGIQLGVQSRSQVILFMNDKVLSKFKTSKGWQAGVDGSVALATLGAGGELDTETSKEPIIGFIFSNKGLMMNLSLEGSKITEIKK